MSAAYLYRSGMSTPSKYSCENVAENESIWLKTVTLTHEGALLYVIVNGYDSDYYTESWKINGEKVATCGYDKNLTTATSRFALVFVLAVKNAQGSYDLCKLDGTVVQSAQTTLQVQSERQELSITAFAPLQ